jgi:transporter family-2 protein
MITILKKGKEAVITSVWPYLLLAIVAGFCLPTQAGINAQLNLWSHSAILTATISFAVGTIGLAVYALILRTPWPTETTIARYPWWIWSGGLLGAFLVASTVVLAPRLGAASMIALIVAGQMLSSIIHSDILDIEYFRLKIEYLKSCFSASI